MEYKKKITVRNIFAVFFFFEGIIVLDFLPVILYNEYILYL